MGGPALFLGWVFALVIDNAIISKYITCCSLVYYTLIWQLVNVIVSIVIIINGKGDCEGLSNCSVILVRRVTIFRTTLSKIIILQGRKRQAVCWEMIILHAKNFVFLREWNWFCKSLLGWLWFYCSQIVLLLTGSFNFAAAFLCVAVDACVDHHSSHRLFLTCARLFPWYCIFSQRLHTAGLFCMEMPFNCNILWAGWWDPFRCICVKLG